MTLYKISWTKSQYDAYIASGGIIPSNYEIFISDAAAGTPNLFTGTGTNTPVSGNVGGASSIVFEDWAANTAYAIGDKVIATVTIGAIGAGARLRRNTAGTSGATFNSTEAAKWTELVIDDDVVPKTDIIDNLTTNDATKVLSAKQGKDLQDLKAPLASPTFTGTVAGITKAMVGLGLADNTADINKIVSTAQQTALDGKSATTHNHAGTYEPSNANIQSHIVSTVNPHSVNATQVGLGNVSNTSDLLKPISTAQQTALDLKVDKITGKGLSTNDFTTVEQAKLSGIATGATANSTDAQLRDRSTHTGSQAQSTITNLTIDLAAKQATLVSGSNIKTINSTSLVGSGNISVAADLPGGSATTAYDDGLNAGNAVIDRATVAGQTILKYETTGTSTFTPPTGVASIRVLVVGGGGSGDLGVSSGVYGHGGGGGFVTVVDSLAVSGAIEVKVGEGGIVPTIAGQIGNNGVQSSLGATTASGGTAANNIGAGGDGGDSGKTINGVLTSYAGGADSTWGAAGGAGAGSVSSAASDTVGSVGGIGLASDITGVSVPYGAGGNGSGTETASPAVTPANVGRGGSGHGADVRAGGSGIVIIRFTTQSRSYQALTGYANDSAAATGGILIGQFYRNSTSGATTQRAV